MRLHVVNFLRPGVEAPGQSLGRIADYARRVEKAGFPGLWVTDSFGRGRATLDPIVALGAIAAVTGRVELGTCVLQVPVRHPVELAHRIQSLQALSGGRLRLGVGSGSTRADFDLVGADYAERFKTLMAALDIMGRAWSGERLVSASGEGALTPWPGTEGGPPVMLGAWRNRRWIVYAAERCAGWIASGLYSQWEELERGMKIYREAGGTRAILANVIVDLKGVSEATDRAQPATITLTGSLEEARQRLQRIRAIGFDDVLCVSPVGALDDIERVRDLL